MAEMTYCTGEAKGGFVCPMKEHCARATRQPKDDAKGWDVFAIPPYNEILKVCNYFWPEANPGLTEQDIPPDVVIHMGEGDSPHPSGMEVFEETDGQYAFVEPNGIEGGASFDLRVPLWPDSDEQDIVFQMLVKTEGEIDIFRAHCAKVRDTKPEEVWLVLDTIRARLKKIIYGEGHVADG